jgi:hypothetical protein
MGNLVLLLSLLFIFLFLFEEISSYILNRQLFGISKLEQKIRERFIHLFHIISNRIRKEKSVS